VNDVSDTTAARTTRRERVGVVVSDARDKTITVRVDRRTTHPLYSKTMERTKKYHAHDETNDANVGDTVRIVETRPLSKSKRWRLQEVLERAK
jgi:small subunit ribosomal protein S17